MHGSAKYLGIGAVLAALTAFCGPASAEGIEPYAPGNTSLLENPGNSGAAQAGDANCRGDIMSANAPAGNPDPGDPRGDDTTLRVSFAFAAGLLVGEDGDCADYQ